MKLPDDDTIYKIYVFLIVLVAVLGLIFDTDF
jgi:hypothetical protein